MHPDRLQDLVQKYLPKGWRVIFHPKLLDKWGSHGSCVYLPKRIYLRKLSSHADLFIFFHEVGHVILEHFPRDLEKHVEEYEAETFAIQAFKDCNIHLPAAVVRDAQERVAGWITHDLEQCVSIDPMVAKWVDE